MILIRNGKSGDNVASMIYRSSPDLLDYVFSFADQSVEEFLKFDYERGKGVFGYSSMLIAEFQSSPVGILTAYPGKEYFKLVFNTVLSCFKFYGFKRALVILKRSLSLSSIFLNPGRQAVYIGNGFVEPSFRFPGVFSSLVAKAEERAIDNNLSYVECDVSFYNESSLLIHLSLGFSIIQECIYRGQDSRLDGTRRLRLKIE